MTRRQKYFLKQKLMGLLLIAFSVVTIFMGPEAAVFALVGIPAGLFWLFTKEMAITDKYYWEMYEEEQDEEEP